VHLKLHTLVVVVELEQLVVLTLQEGLHTGLHTGLGQGVAAA
jgi:hypothetical protein